MRSVLAAPAPTFRFVCLRYLTCFIAEASVVVTKNSSDKKIWRPGLLPVYRKVKDLHLLLVVVLQEPGSVDPCRVV